MGQSHLQEQAAKDAIQRLQQAAIQSDIDIYVLFRGLIGHVILKVDGQLKAPSRKQHMDYTHYLPATIRELLQLQAITGTWHHAQGEPTRYLRPAACKSHLSLTSDFTFFLGRILGKLPKHTLFTVSASCCCHKHMWGSLEMGTCHIPGISQWTYNWCCLTWH